ncbi:MAG: 16S rRNA (adenine(1518)-N(6)/adenine(1519)-N(6))-dimethyltransferase RsmA [Bacteroidales bacterium]|nr:16S rRNA (adenine(1518)-N(6)/adenine(1519)-N(6))-dimethyltransferase RsmA [Bacteroidales bacterium]
MEVRAKKSLGQHFLTDQRIAQDIVAALRTEIPGQAGNDATGQAGRADGNAGVGEAGNGNGKPRAQVLEVGPGMGVLTQYLLQREDIDLRAVEIDRESVDYLYVHYPAIAGKLIQGDFLRLPLDRMFTSPIHIIGNFPYNISSQIFFKVIDNRNRVPQVVCMIQKEVAERIAEKPGTKTYGILSVLLQAWYDIEYLFTVGEGAFNPPPKVKSAVIRLTRNDRQSLDCDEALFKKVVKTAFGQRRKTLRNSLKTLFPEGFDTSDPIFDLRPERLSVEDFVRLTRML